MRVAMRLSARDDDDPSSSALFLSAPLPTVLGAAVPPLVDGPLTRAVRATFEAWEKASARTAMEREHGRGEEEDADESEFGGGSDDDDEGEWECWGTTVTCISHANPLTFDITRSLYL